MLTKTLRDQKICFTGALAILRWDAGEMCVAAGAKVSNTVSKNTTLLVAGDRSGSKFDKANALGVEIIDEIEFLKRVERSLETDITRRLHW